MKVLAIDIGTGTQDILLLDTEGTVENALKLIMPSPTLLVGRRVRQATKRCASVLFEGVLMGGGPCAWALRDHAEAGLPTYATPDAARTLDDDLERVAELGVVVVSEDEAAGLSVEEHIPAGDLMLEAVRAALGAFGVPLEYNALAVAVFDHGDAPPGVSDRKFRFDYLREVLSHGGLTAFAHRRGTVPPEMTRLLAVERSAPEDASLVLMDTGPAAVLGALEDPLVRVEEGESVIVANIGNFHALAFHLKGGLSAWEVAGLFEHHTGEVSSEYMERLLQDLGNGTLTNEEVFGSMGHGALVLDAHAGPPSRLAVLGPQRNLLRGSRPDPYFAVPHGDQMVAGCFGLLRGLAAQLPEHAEQVERVLSSSAVRQPDW
ncbi:MAG: DUF1786 domain-containing protein [Chloroflexota bacterium]|nr:DUF1786 domain-containing protein [Chloroflexota bacterium]